MMPLLAGLSGALVVAGLLGVVWGLVPQPEPDSKPQRVTTRQSWWQHLSPRTRAATLVALAVGVVVAVLTGWILAAIVLPLVVLGLPYVAATSPEKARIATLEALAEWTRSLAGVLTVGVGLEQALVATLRSTPEAIRPQVGRLVARLSARWHTEPALRQFAQELDDATGDLVAGALILSARHRGAGLAAILTGLAESVADDVTARRKIEADRAKPRQTARLVTIISVVFLTGLALSGPFMAPYATGLGQLVLGVLLAGYAVTLVWMRRMTTGKPPARILAPAGTRG